MKTEFMIHLAAKGAVTLDVPVPDWDEATDVYFKYIDAYELRPRKLDKRCGELSNATGKVIAQLGYDGRIIVTPTFKRNLTR